MEAPGVELDGVKTKNISGCAGLHKDSADLDVAGMGRARWLESGWNLVGPTRNG